MDRFWNKVTIGDPADCWPFVGHVGNRGYGTFWLEGRTIPAHRAAYLLTHGELPPSVDHTCHNRDPSCALGDDCPHRRCCNPDHLVASTSGDNSRAKRNRCRRGLHEWRVEGVSWSDPAGDYWISADGRWRCIHCRRARDHRVASGGAVQRYETCRRGHDLTDPANVYTSPKGLRQCRTCQRLRARKDNPMSPAEAGRRGAAARWGHSATP